MIPLVDKLGTPIKKDDFIVYGTLLGRSAALKFGRVLEVKYTESVDNNSKPIVSDVRITVQGVEEDWHGNLKLSRKGTLQFNDRVVVLNYMQVPDEYWKLFI